ncbi:MAG: hypothetical protein LBF68_01100 [Christensenellaceae bacterium]|jgi:S-DNA-T family DNA segregation ATPase FtsK/SpoIIIE|nr:hypothetical protein [Christensenellaceae bacterium]
MNRFKVGTILQLPGWSFYEKHMPSYTNDTKEDIIEKEVIIKSFAILDIAIVVNHVVVAPQVVKYYILYDNPNDSKKANQSLSILKCLLHSDIILNFSKYAHHELVMPRTKRPLYTIMNFIVDSYGEESEASIPTTIGVDTNNHHIIADFAKLPHMLIAGETGGGKSVLLNAIITSLLCKKFPMYLRMIMIDTKNTELSLYKNIPFLDAPIITSFDQAHNILTKMSNILDSRYDFLEKAGVRDISVTSMPRYLIIIDELADLMLSHKTLIEPVVVRLAQLGRAAGIHLLIATQRPTVNVVTGLIKANMPARVALKTVSYRDSMTIIDYKGAETLTGHGDCLVKLPNTTEITRCQVPFVSEEFINSICDYWKGKDCIAEKK